MVQKPITYLDGAMGTMLQQRGLQPGSCPEALNLTAPETVAGIEAEYIAAGSEIIYANTFGANRLKAARSGYTPDELIRSGIACARAAIAQTPHTGPVRVALDIGPIGQMLAPNGPLSFDEAYDIFREMLVCGEAAGADLAVFETMTDLYEVKAAVLAAKEHTHLPVFVTMSFERGGRTFTGCSVEAMAAVLNGLGADAMGINCSLGPDEIAPMAEKLCALTDRPVIVKPNAGLPDPSTGRYAMDAEHFGAAMERFAAMGCAYLGGCCGTTPDYIRALSAHTAGGYTPRSAIRPRTAVCTPTRTVSVDGVRVIGERINPTGKKRFRQALLEGDLGYIVHQASEQEEAGADILDINVGVPGINEAEMMTQVVRAVQEVTDLPLQIDSSDVHALEAGLRAVNGKAIVNSVDGDPKRLAEILPLVKKYGAAVVGLAMDEHGIPATAAERFAIAERIVHTAETYGIAREDVFIDCLTLTVSAEQDKARETLRAIEMVRSRLGVHCTLGVSNISFGLPRREAVTAGFLTLALASGLDLPIINPNARPVMDAVRVFRVLNGSDRNAEAYIAACVRQSEADAAAAQAQAQTQPAPAAPQPKSAMPAAPRPAESARSGDESPLAHAVIRGLRAESRDLTGQLLAGGMDETAIINDILIPALDTVGDRYERGIFFLPQLINSAAAATEAFDVIHASIRSKGTADVSKGKIIVATVKGDIHDIGKNIVKTVLENYGYTVIDLGKDVAPETVVQTAAAEDVHLIGLSALMTTTLPAMRDTVAALRASGHSCRIWVGGAVLTPEYAAEIGADYYARDAKASVDIAKEFFGA